MEGLNSSNLIKIQWMPNFLSISILMFQIILSSAFPLWSAKMIMFNHQVIPGILEPQFSL